VIREEKEEEEEADGTRSDTCAAATHATLQDHSVPPPPPLFMRLLYRLTVRVSAGCPRKKEGEGRTLVWAKRVLTINEAKLR